MLGIRDEKIGEDRRLMVLHNISHYNKHTPLV